MSAIAKKNTRVKRENEITCDLSKHFNLDEEKGVVVFMDNCGKLQERTSKNGKSYFIYSGQGYSARGGFTTITCFGALAIFIHRMMR
jgi:hypothetical protein